MRRTPMTLALIGALGLSAPLAAPAAPPASVVQTAAIRMAASPQEAAPISGYASRESQAVDLEAFSGGHDAVYISAGVVVLVVLILLLV